MTSCNDHSCPLYPCFDTCTGAAFSRKTSGRIIFDCGCCSLASSVMASLAGSGISVDVDTIDTISEIFFLKQQIFSRKSNQVRNADKILDSLRKTSGLSKEVFVLSDQDKKEALDIEKRDKCENIGVYSALSRDVCIAIAHNSSFRDPPIPIVLMVKNRIIIGEMTSNGKKFYGDPDDCVYVLPPVPFPELDQFGECIVSASPGYILDSWLRKRMHLEHDDATLFVGLNASR